MRTVLWQRIDSPGSEWCALERTADGWRLQGIVLAEVATAPVLVHYAVALAPDWSTRAVEIAMRSGDAIAPRELRLTVAPNSAGRSSANPPGHVHAPGRSGGVARAHRRRSGVLASTNTLPIRRLDPAIGESVAVTAAWVRFPELTIEPLPQRYTRLAERRYRYESAGGAFVAEIEVDDLGLVTTYEGGWRRIAASPDH